ncbi:alpha/beta hydrolase [Urechidicola vernalis]|uniref:Alpha/beta hydrolase n=1 Tax=Urechidicola vernalis TaxID=3075600 RepID=A0ABU2Y340_9FLAO|nr:alpha/beta hydrolase [Urechidicola sp. P050]MDT0552621.1 alpha/beta hydrolase [Urechidicola sp. P050]
MKKISVVLLLLLSIQLNAKTNIEKKTIEFPSKDGLKITADFYEVENAKGMILLCHQAGYSRGEYLDTAKKINALGYSCLAIDQRSGNEVNGIENETAKRANEKGLATNYIDAKKDVEAAIDFLYSRNNNRPILIVGSSYSASLVLLVGNDNDKVKAIAAFSPGEYLKGINVTESITSMSKPTFVTSSRSETPKVEKLIQGINQQYVSHHKPIESGIHGSRGLWESTPGQDGYWKSFKSFLKQVN